MAPPRSRSAPSKRDAAPPNPSPDLQAAVDEFNLHLLHAASEGDLRLFKVLLWALDKSRWDPREVVEAAKDEGVGALHLAAGNGSLPVCRYLVEELGVDVDAVDDDSQTPLIWAILGGKMETVSYLLDHGANPSKVDDQGFAPLHYATGAGDHEMVELLLAKGVSVDPVSVSGTPLHIAASEGHDEAMKILLENNADYNKKVPGAGTPLLVAITASSVKCVKLLVEAGADVNDGLETPLAAAANKGLTACLKCLLEAGANSGDHVRRIAELKSLGVKALKRNDYLTAATLYSAAMEHDRHDATLLSNRSLCWLRMGDGHKALQDALTCREMRPAWPKGCYRHGAALMLLKDYGSACNAFLDAAKLDPWSPDIEAALREAMNSLKTSRGATKAT